MAKIPGYIHAFIGLIMIMFSYWIQQNTESNLIFFYVIGIGLITFGVFKIITKIILNDKETPKQTRKKQNTNNTQNKKRIITCPKCQTKHYSNSNYCHLCGTKLLK